MGCRTRKLLAVVAAFCQQSRLPENSSELELYDSAAKRLQNLIRQGVTTVEIKTGYGLDLETEIKMLRVINRLRNELPIQVSRTLLAAHAVPPEFAEHADEYVELVCGEIIPAAAELCDAIDVFCESIAFSLDQTRRIFEAAKITRPELGLKIHAEQLTHLGGASLAAEMGAMSADHLEYLQPADCQQMAKNKDGGHFASRSFLQFERDSKNHLSTNSDRPAFQSPLPPTRIREVRQ